MRPYDRLIGAALDGNRLLFARQDTVEAAWRVVDPILGDAVPVHPYPQGSWGPKEADGCCPTARPGTTRPAEPPPRRTEPWHAPRHRVVIVGGGFAGCSPPARCGAPPT
jgi:hypothetical protein